MPVDPAFLLFGRRWRYLTAGYVANQRGHDDADCCPFDRNDASQYRAQKDSDISTGLDQPGAAQHFAFVQMLRQNRIFDRAEKCRVYAHREKGDHHQRNGDECYTVAEPCQRQSCGADKHDQYLAELYDPNDPGLIAGIGQLPGERGKQKKWQYKYGGCNRTEQRFGRFVVVNAIHYEKHHGVFEQVIVKRAKQLRYKKRQKTSLVQQRQ